MTSIKSKKAIIVYSKPFTKVISGTNNRVMNILKVLKEFNIVVDELVRYRKNRKTKEYTGDLVDKIIYMEELKIPFFKQHGFVHAHEAMENAYKFFPELMNERIANIIERHMFPLNIIPPKYKEGWVVTYADKRLSMDVVVNIKALPKYLGLARVVYKVKKFFRFGKR